MKKYFLILMHIMLCSFRLEGDDLFEEIKCDSTRHYTHTNRSFFDTKNDFWNPYSLIDNETINVIKMTNKPDSANIQQDLGYHGYFQMPCYEELTAVDFQQYFVIIMHASNGTLSMCFKLHSMHEEENRLMIKYYGKRSKYGQEVVAEAFYILKLPRKYLDDDILLNNVCETN